MHFKLTKTLTAGLCLPCFFTLSAMGNFMPLDTLKSASIHENTQHVQEQEVLIEQLIELMAHELEEGFDYTELLEKINFYRKYPIDLNRTDGSDLAELDLLNPLQISNILAHRKQTGGYLDVMELQAVEGIDIQTAGFLLSLVKVGAKQPLNEPFNKMVLKGEHDLMIRHGRQVQLGSGYGIEDPDRSRYLGSPDRLFLRYRYRHKDRIQVAINMKKDPGEQFFSGAQRYGFDFYSASLSIKKPWRNIKQLIIGDYVLQFGQGLSVWSGLAFGKGAMLQQMARQGQGLRPYTSTNEFAFLRGITLNYALNKRTEFIPFISYRQLSATLLDLPDQPRSFSTLRTSGLHRTPNEVVHRHALGQLAYGFQAAYRHHALTLGLSLHQISFDRKALPNPQLYNQFAFAGNQLTNGSLHYSYSVENMYFFGETAHSIGSGMASTNGLIATLSNHWSVALHQRYFGRNYHAFLNQPVAESALGINEQGFYSGLIYQPSRRWEWVGYVDLFKFPWLRYRIDGPSLGVDLFTQVNYLPNKQVKIVLRYRQRNREENTTVNNTIRVLEDVKKHQVRADFQYQVTKSLKLRSRVEFVYYEKPPDTEEGYLLYQDVIYTFFKERFTMNTRVALFNTDGFYSRIYAFESDVLYGYSFPFYSNQGIRSYINLRYRIRKGLDFWARYASFYYPNLTEIGSGLDLIEGKQRADFRVQLRYQF